MDTGYCRCGRWGMGILQVVVAAVVVTTPLGCQSGGGAADPSNANNGAMGADAVQPWDAAPIEGPRATLLVNGMSCPKCANNINLRMSSVPGVESVNVDLGRGEVRVGFMKGQVYPSRLTLARAIDESGFTLTEIRVP